MAYIPPNVRWYLADVVLEHAIDGDPRNVVHVNVILIEAASPEQAYEKAIALGKASEQAYANTEGREVRVTFRGLRDLTVIHEHLEDGAELTYEEHVGVTEDRLAKWVSTREDLSVFQPRRAKTDGPNYMPGDVAEQLREAGFTPEDLAGGE